MTAEEVNKHHAGVLPPGATLAPMESAVEVKASKGRSHGLPKQEASRTQPKQGSPGDRWSMLNAFVDVKIEELTRVEMAVWFVLFRDTKRVTGQAITGETDLARRCGCSERSIRSAIRQLEKKNLLQQVKRGNLFSGQSVYKVMLP